MTNNITSY